MKAVRQQISADILERRKRTGSDRWDEMWEGVLHMGLMPNRVHQDLEGALEAWLRARWAGPRDGRVYHQINLASIGGWPNDYRIPDLVLLGPERFAIDKNEYFEGAPDIVVEIRSPGDETEAKMPFYARLGVSEVWIIDRDTREPEIRGLRGGRYVALAARDGWLESAVTGVQMRAGPASTLVIRLAGDDSSCQALAPA